MELEDHPRRLHIQADPLPRLILAVIRQWMPFFVHFKTRAHPSSFQKDPTGDRPLEFDGPFPGVLLSTQCQQEISHSSPSTNKK